MKAHEKARHITIFLIASIIIGFGNLFLIGFNRSPELNVVTGFIALVLHFGLIALLGLMLGKVLDLVSGKYVRDINGLANALRLGRWIPVFAMWAIPFVTELGISAVTAGSLYYYLASKSLLCLEEQQAKRLVMVETLLNALLVTLLVQVLEPGFGWFAVYEPYGLLKASSALIFVLLTLYAASTRLPSDFMITAQMHSRIAEEFISDGFRPAVKWTLMTSVVFAIIWQTVSSYGFEAWISSPWKVLTVMISRLSDGHDHIWGDIAASMGEICLGLAVTGGIALYIREFVLLRTTVQSSACGLLYLTHIAPIVFVPLLIHWRILGGFWLATTCVALLSFFPILRVLVGLTKDSLKFKLVSGSLEALPYAFVGMLFGETMHSFGGLGFTLTSASGSRGSPAEAMAIVLIIVLLMTSMALLLRYLARTEGTTNGVTCFERGKSASRLYHKKHE